MRKGGRRRDHRTSKIGGRRKRREEQRREKEGRKEGRGRLGVLADERIDPRRVKHGICLCLPLSLSILAYVPPARVAAALPLSLSPPRALPSSLSTGRHQSPPLHSSPRTAAHRLLPHPHPAFPASLPPCRLKPPFSPLLRARPRQTKTNYAAFSEPQRAPTSYTTLARRPFAPPPLSILVYRLPRNSPPTSPNHPHATFLVPAQTTPSPSPPAASETLCYVGHQMGAQPPTHSRRASCPRTTSRLLQLCQPPRILLLPPLALAAAAS